MLVSFIIPCYNSEKTLQSVVDEITSTMHNDNYEIILINASAPVHTFDVIRSICEEHENITGIDMAKNFGQHSALMAGFNFAQGDVIVCLDDDGQTPANEVYKLLDKINEGYDLVYAKYKEKKHSGFRNFGSSVNKLMMECMLDKPKELFVSSYFAAKKFVIDEMKKYENAYPYVMGLAIRTTNKVCNVVVNHREREIGQSGYSLSKLWNLWINGFTSFSVKPLRMATYGGLFVAILGFSYILYVIINKLTNPLAPIGWSSTIAVNLLLGGMILLVLGMIGEYIGRIYICLNSSPQYVIRSIVKSNRSFLYNSNIGNSKKGG